MAGAGEEKQGDRGETGDGGDKGPNARVACDGDVCAHGERPSWAYRWLPWIVLGGVWCVVAAIKCWLWREPTYWDFGDGNYLYVGRRLNEGLIPYRDILAPQPPLHLLMCELSQRVGLWLWGPGDSVWTGGEYWGARLYGLIVRCLQSALVLMVAQQVLRCPNKALVGAVLYLFLPIGFWWNLCLMSENPEIVFLLGAMLGILRFDARGAAWAGVASALAMHCNMTAVPYFLVNALFLVCRRPRLAMIYGGSALGMFSVGAGLSWMWAGYDYLDNVLLNQVGSFPRENFAQYAWGKVSTQSAGVFLHEGLWLLIGSVSLLLGTAEHRARVDPRSPAGMRWEYAAWSALGMWLSIGFTMKGGTADYIFVLGEPAVAIFAGDGLVRAGRWIGGALRGRFGGIGIAGRPWWFAVTPGVGEWRSMGATLRHTMPLLAVIYTLVVVGFAVWWAYNAAFYRTPTLPFHPSVKGIGTLIDQTWCEAPAPLVREVVDLIEAHTQPGDAILAPPFYAYMTRRTVAAELAENFLWQIKLQNEYLDDTEGAATIKFEELAGMLRRGEVPLLLLDRRQTGAVPNIAHAVELAYEPLRDDIQTRNTTLGVYVPRRSGSSRP